VQADRVNCVVMAMSFKEVNNSVSSACDRFLGDQCMLTDTQLPKSFKSTLRVEVIRVVELLRSNNSNTCLLCNSSTKENGVEITQSQHWQYECEYFNELRTVHDRRVNNLLVSAGRCFHANPSKAVGFACGTVPDDGCGRGGPSAENLASTDIGEFVWQGRAHTVSMDRVRCLWMNANLTSPGVQWGQFREAMLPLMVCSIKAPIADLVPQPHPAVLKWLVDVFKLSCQTGVSMFNCTSGIFSGPPMLAKVGETVVDCGHAPMTGFLLPPPGAQSPIRGGFHTMRNSAEGWQSALSKFALDRRDGDQLGTSVVMLVLDKSQSEQTVTDAVLNAKGVELLRCPPNTLAVVHANGFAEYKDDSVQNRTEDDYRQEGRKLPGPRQPVQSYSLSNNGSIVAPKEGCAKHTPRHGGMSNKFPVVFIYFGLLKRDQLWQTCASLLPDLALVLANTSPTAESSHPKHCVKWIPKVETDVSIFSLHYRLRAAQPELKCFSNYKHEVYAEWPKGPSAARRLSAGYVPSSASKFVLSLGANSIKEARTVLVRVATMGMTLCRDMESVGLQQLRRNFGRIGLASFDTNDGSHVEGRHDKQYSCDNNACPRATFSRFFVPNVQEATVPNVKRAIQQKLCFTCAAKAAAAWPCTASEQDLSSKASGSAANAKGPLTRTRSGTSPTKPSALSSAGQTSKAFKTRAIADAAWSLWNSLNTERSVRVVGKAMVPFIRVDGNENCYRESPGRAKHCASG
jgi:hypothetical protein